MEIKLNVPEKYKERFGCLELTGWDCEEKYYLYFAEGWGCYDGWTPQEGNIVIGCVPVRNKKEALDYIKDAVKEGVDKE